MKNWIRSNKHGKNAIVCFGILPLVLLLFYVFKSFFEASPSYSASLSASFHNSQPHYVNGIVFPLDSIIIIILSVSFFGGLFISFLCLVFKTYIPQRHSMFLLGACASTSSVLKILSLPIIFSIFDIFGAETKFYYSISISYMSLQCFILLLLCNASNNARKWKTICPNIALVLLLLMLILQHFKILNFYTSSMYYAFSCIILQIITVQLNFKKTKDWLWAMIFPLSSIIDISLILLFSTVKYSVYLLLAIMTTLVIKGIDFIKTTNKREEELATIWNDGMDRQTRLHFLYNTMSSIYFLCREDPDQAMKAIEDFATYLQAHSTGISSNSPIPFKEELNNTKAYLDVEKMRFEDDLDIEFDVQFTDFSLPVLSLQAIVENAVKHGIAKTWTKEHLLISTYMENDNAVIVVDDNGPGFDCPFDKETHVGLSNVQYRLKTACSGTLDIHSEPNVGTTVTIRIPL